MKTSFFVLAVSFAIILLPLLFLLGLSMIYAYRQTQKKPVKNAKQLRIKTKRDDDLLMMNQQMMNQQMMNQQNIDQMNQINQQIIQQQSLPPNT